MKALSRFARLKSAHRLILVTCLLLSAWLLAACGEATKPASAVSTTAASAATVTIAPTTAPVSAPTVAATTAVATPTRAATSAPVAVTTAIATTAPAVALTTAPAIASGNLEAGKKVYLEQCAGCHGAQAMGGYGTKIAATKLSYEEVLAQVRNPKNKGQNIMTAFTPAEVSDAQVRDIFAFLKSLP